MCATRISVGIEEASALLKYAVLLQVGGRLETDMCIVPFSDKGAAAAALFARFLLLQHLLLLLLQLPGGAVKGCRALLQIHELFHIGVLCTLSLAFSSWDTHGHQVDERLY